MYYSAKTSKHRQNGLRYVPKKLLTWMLKKARGGLKATVGNRVLPITLSTFFFALFCFFQLESCFPGGLCSEAFQHILDIVGLS